jgi:hypothetical protein
MQGLRFDVVVLGLLVTACRPQTQIPAAVSRRADPELLRTLAVLATNRASSPSELDDARRRIDAGRLTLREYIDGLLAGQAFASEVAPLIILRQFLSQETLGAPLQFVLSHTNGPHPVYYLREPCAWDDAVPVRPWWLLFEGREDTIRVCPDTYRREQWTIDAPPGEPEISCLSVAATVQTTGQPCGCGPDLIRCFDSTARQQELEQSLRDELRGSIEHNVASNLPLEQIFTSNESFRDRNAEFLMRSYVAENDRRAPTEASLRELATWPTGGVWAAREDLARGQNAGILTSPQLIHYQLDRRQRMTAIYDVLWCIGADSVGATPEALLSIVGADLQFESAGWRDLAGRPICTSCHARLDYGLQFFLGFANGNLQAYFVPGLQQPGRGPLYVRDIGDPRGEAELSPNGFAELAVAQPEFRRCMARDFAEYVLGNQVTPDQIAAVESAMVPSSTSARELMRVALNALVAAWPEHSVAPRVTAAARAPETAGDLHAQLEAHCLDCHDHQAGRPDLAVPKLDRPTVVAMLEAVAFGRMPKDTALSEPERVQFLDNFIGSIWVGADAAAARNYFVDRSVALPAYRPEVAFALIHHVAEATPPTGWRMMENSVRSDVQQVTRGLAAVTGLAAIEACREHHKARAEIDHCISEAMKLDNLSGRGR